eukprot:m.53154 g.53154  ORF g.53154 m.53154 type:complete len:357 (-) comp9144_c0_seq1:269-1339(-)
MSAVYGALCCFDPSDEFSEPCYRRCLTSIGVACGCLGYAKSAKGHKYAQFGSTRKHNDEEVLRGLADDDEQGEDDELVEAAHLMGTISTPPGAQTDGKRPSGGRFPSKDWGTNGNAYGAAADDAARSRASVDGTGGYVPVGDRLPHQPSATSLVSVTLDGTRSEAPSATSSDVGQGRKPSGGGGGGVDLVDMSPAPAVQSPNPEDEYLQILADRPSVASTNDGSAEYLNATTDYLQIGSPMPETIPELNEGGGEASAALGAAGSPTVAPEGDTADMLLMDQDFGVIDQYFGADNAGLAQLDAAADAQIDAREDEVLGSLDAAVDARETEIEAELDALIDSREAELTVSGSGDLLGE